MKLKVLNALLFIVILISFSCTSYKTVPYFQDLRKDSVSTEAINNFAPLVIQNGDLLGIHVTSMNREADAVVNYNLERPTANSNLDRSEESAVIGYLVDNNGNINVPYIGEVKATGNTILQMQNLLKTRLAEYLTTPVVNVRLQNFRITIMGDVKNAGVYPVTAESINVLQALSLAGDLNTTGIRNILLIREHNGQREYIPLDLTSKKTITSPYYYLKNNDVIYVQPNKDKVASSDSAFQRASIIISALSVLAILITRFN